MDLEHALPKPSLSVLRARLEDVDNARERMLLHLQNLKQRINSPASTKEEKLEMNHEVLESLDLEQRLEFDQVWVECEIGNREFGTWIAHFDRAVPLEYSRFDHSKEKTKFLFSNSPRIRSSVEDTEIAQNSTLVVQGKHILTPAPLRVANHIHHKTRSANILQDRVLHKTSSVLGQVSDNQCVDLKSLAPQAPHPKREPETKGFPLIQGARAPGIIPSKVSRIAWQNPEILAAPEISQVNQCLIVETQSLAGTEQKFRQKMFKR